MMLTVHFSLEELTDSQVAARLGLDNMPSSDVVDHLQILCETILDPARQALGPLRISSGYRSPAVNAAISGASKTSAHIQGWAADVIPLAADKLELARWVRENVPFDQIILEFGVPGDPAWVHLSADPQARGQVLRILAGTGYESVTL